MFSKNKNLAWNMASLCLAALTFLFLAEGLIRLIPALTCEGYRSSSNDRIVYELQPDFRIRSLNAMISRQGLNDRFFSLQKPAGIFRIAVVGDSTSFGWKVQRKDSFPKVLERILNQKKSGRRFEVINFSVPGYNTSQEGELIRQKVVSFDPDLVLLVFCANDVHVCNYFKPRITALNYLYHRSYFIHYLLRGADVLMRHHAGQGFVRPWTWFKKNILGMFYEKQRIYPFPGLEETEYIALNPPESREFVPPAYWYMLGTDNYKIHLSVIQDFLKSKHITFVSSGLFLPQILEIHQELGVEHVCDFYRLASAQDYAGKYSLDGHFNKQGHLQVAKFLYRFLEKEGLLP